jgi:hypothetical protein
VNARAERKTRNRGGGGAERTREAGGRADARWSGRKYQRVFFLHFIIFRSRDYPQIVHRDASVLEERDKGKRQEPLQFPNNTRNHYIVKHY